MSQILGVPVLSGRLVRLEPLSTEHAASLAAEVATGREAFGFTTVPEGPEETERYVAQRVAWRDEGLYAPFAQVRVSDGRAVGCTSYLTLRRRPDDQSLFAVEIGGTWLADSAQRTGINREAKFLLLGHAFETLGVERVDLKTDARNAKARSAIEALGTQFEGVLRSWQPSQAPGEAGKLRDSAMYSMLVSEWPAARDRLQASIGQQ